MSEQTEIEQLRQEVARLKVLVAWMWDRLQIPGVGAMEYEQVLTVLGIAPSSIVAYVVTVAAEGAALVQAAGEKGGKAE